jgi:hypothetical protein
MLHICLYIFEIFLCAQHYVLKFVDDLQLVCGFLWVCSESWGMGAEGFRRAPMMHEKLTTLVRTRYTTEQPRSENQET